MAEKMIFDFKIETFPEQTSQLNAVNGSARIIPFTGSVESELFTGKILPGAADVQITTADGVRHMHACYMFEGKDYTGENCRLFIDNNGYFMRGARPRPFETVPSMMTDSKALQEYLHAARFRATGTREEDGFLHIRVYDILA